MRSATSCFKTLVRSDLRHYWPIGFVYTGIWIIGLPVSIWNAAMSYGNKAQRLAEVTDVTYNLQFMGVIMAAIFGVIMAMAAYSYLMTARSVGLHHSLPVKRSTQFFAHFTGGMGMLLLGNVIAAALTLVVEAVTGYVSLKALLWWLVMVSLLDFIFFSIAIFCAMLTGWVLAVPVIYVGINFVAVVLETLLESLAGIFYFGYVGDFDPLLVVYWLTPAMKLGGALRTDEWTNGPISHMDMEAVKITVIYAVFALALLGISFLLYRLRHSESAGDPVAYRWARPIFRCAIALVGGLALGMGVHDLVMLGNTSLPALMICVLLMMALCYIAAEMIICRSFRVFKSSWKGLAALCAVLVLICVGLKMDVFGYQTYVPEADEVKAITVSTNCNAGFDVSNCTDPDAIAGAIATHNAILAQGLDQPAECDNTNSNVASCTVHLSYTMQNGRQVSRHYSVCMERGSELHKVVNDLAGVEAVRTAALLGDTLLKVEDIYGGYVSCYGENDYHYDESLSEEEAQELYAALLRDVEQGHGRRDMMSDLYSTVDMSFDTEKTDVSICSNGLTKDCTETIELLLKMGVAEKAEDLFCHW
ncbi:MAG: hypothetical protein KBS74_01610 [Clostridiales bacterium]|nr:hypothetical protein [Candidatus Cacconaster stercorequi]